MADAVVEGLLDLHLRLFDVLLVVLNLEVGVGGIEGRVRQAGERGELPFLACRGRAGDADAELVSQRNRLTKRLRMVRDQALAERAHRRRDALGLGELAARDLEPVALDAGLERGLVERRVCGGGGASGARESDEGRRRRSDGQHDPTPAHDSAPTWCVSLPGPRSLPNCTCPRSASTAITYRPNSIAPGV